MRPDRLRPVTPLTARDRALLAQLAEHEPLATSELLLLFFTGPRTCRQRLTQLERAELLLRVYPAAGRRGTGEALWFLTAKARLLLAVPARRTPSLSLPDLEHRRAVARFFCVLVERSLQHPAEGLWCWHAEARAEHGTGGRIRPDGYGRYLLPNGEVTFYLEVDRSTEQGKRVGQKLAGYTRALATVDRRERANRSALDLGHHRQPALPAPPRAHRAAPVRRAAAVVPQSCPPCERLPRSPLAILGTTAVALAS